MVLNGFRSYFREVVLQCSSGRCCCCCSTPSTYLDSPHLTRRRQDSIEHTSRSRSGESGDPAQPETTRQTT
ncbi:hypothetical protein E2C01_102467 [Portunus trituberculatus]|uniref:Uncharacterized protein n=1 Tax=Portunus trituberculatus TaxID=210409 RepID=A0A5B7KIF4_PORTR|nr:hypothetical protein [Portunus trituberculatus]